MAWKKKNKVDEYDDYEDDDYDGDSYEDEDGYEDDYEDDDYADYDEDEDYAPKNPLKPLVISLLVLVAVLAALVAILFLRLQSANGLVDELNESLDATRAELNNLLEEKTSGTPETTAPANPETTSEPTPSPTPEPTATPEPTPTPAPTPAPLLRDTVSDTDLDGVYRPREEAWYVQAVYGEVTAEYMLALRYGPAVNWNERMVLYKGDKVEVLALQDKWLLVKAEDGRYGWAMSAYIKESDETVPMGAATEATPEAETTPETTADAGTGGIAPEAPEVDEG